MWVVNNDKERCKLYVKNDIQSNITNLSEVSNRLHDAIEGINRAVAGTMTGVDQQMIGDCQKATYELSLALQTLYRCQQLAEQLETREWIADD